jgi:glycosyltransferase involved in cell wall biosynthesis
LRARAALRAEHDVVVIGIVANLYPQKNQQLAIWALFGLPERIRSRARLDLFGAGPDEAHLRALAAELGVTAHVRFWGFRADVREMLAGLDILLTVAKVEAAPISLLEAMAAGLPIIAAPHHGALDLITDELSGLITKDWSVDGMTRALGRALADATWRARAGAWGRRRLLSEFNIETVADRHAALYRRLLRNN